MFAATRKKLALMVVLFEPEGKMSNLSMYMSKSKKVRMEYSCHGRYEVVHIVFSLLSLYST